MVGMQAVGASQRVFQLLDRLAEMQPCGQEVPRGRPEGADLNLRSVSFAYPSRPEIQVQSSIIDLISHKLPPSMQMLRAVHTVYKVRRKHPGLGMLSCSTVCRTAAC